jgi:cupin fold WbuC family metalloprotein
MIIDKKLLDEVSARAQASPRLRMNYNFHDGPESKAQRLLNALERGTVLPIHRHRHTDETYVVLRGKIVVLFYDDSGAQTEEFRLDPSAGNYGVHIPKGVWHSLVVIEPAVIFEVKDGPYTPIAPEDMME